MRTKDGALRISVHDGERSTASCIITRENFKFNFAQSYQRSESSDRLAWLHVSAKGKAGNPSERLKIKIIPRRTFLRVEQHRLDWPASRRSCMNRCLASIRYDFPLIRVIRISRILAKLAIADQQGSTKRNDYSSAETSSMGLPGHRVVTVARRGVARVTGATGGRYQRDRYKYGAIYDSLMYS